MTYPRRPGCSEPDCDDVVFALGLCLSHYGSETTRVRAAQAATDDYIVAVATAAVYDATYAAAYDSASTAYYAAGVAAVYDYADEHIHPTTVQRPKRPKEHGVYRHYAEGDILLYVGYTSNLKQRNSAHAMAESWWKEVAETTWESFDTRDEALFAELKAIQTEHPLWNVRRRKAR